MPQKEIDFGGVSSYGAPSRPSFERRKITRIAERVVILLAMIALMFFLVIAAMLSIFAE